jgi:hypothetical protein
LEGEGFPIFTAAFADVHCYEEVRERPRYELEAADERADVLALAGDLTCLGKVAEAERVAEVARQVRVPMVGALGNHDGELDREDTIAVVIGDAGARILDSGTPMGRIPVR